MKLMRFPAIRIALIMGSVLFLPNAAHALSAGCTQWSFTGNSNGVAGSNLAFTVNEVASAQMSNSGGLTATYTFTYTDNTNGSATITETGSVPAGAAVTESITVPRDTTSGRLSLVINTNGPLAITVSCVFAAPAPGASGASTTQSSVISAVSRSQVSLVQKNIGSRATTVSGGAGTVPAGPEGQNGNSFAGFGAPAPTHGRRPQFDYRLRPSNSSNSLRQLAMMGSFDTSTSNGLSALGLGPADQGQPGGAGGVDGRAALDTASPFAIWGNGSFTSVDNDFATGAYDGDVWAYNVGTDYRFAETLTAGVSLGYSDTDLTTSFNNGSYREKGWVVSPYAIYRPLENLTVIGELGYGTGDVDVTRSGNAVTGNTDSDMWYAALTTSYLLRPSEALPLSLTPSVALVAARKTVDSYRESTGTAVADTRSNTRQIRPALELAYDMQPSGGLTVTPFLESGLVHDFTDEINKDKTAFSFGGGIRLYDRATGFNAAFEGSYLAGRTDYAEYTLSGTVLYGFALNNEDGRSIGILKPFVAATTDEYGGQRIRTGLGFGRGALTSELAFSHVLAIADEDERTDAKASIIALTVSLPF